MKLDSLEQIKKPPTVTEIENQNKNDLDQIKNSKKKCLIKVFLSLFIVILAIAIGLVIFFSKKNKKSEETEVYEIKSDSGTNNAETVTLDEF